MRVASTPGRFVRYLWRSISMQSATAQRKSPRSTGADSTNCGEARTATAGFQVVREGRVPYRQKIAGAGEGIKE